MEKKLIVLSDTDGPGASSQTEAISAFNRRFPDQNFCFADWTGFDVLTNLAANLGKENPAIAATWLFAADIMSQSQPTPGSQNAIEELKNIGTSFAFVTSRPADQRSMTKSWIAKYFPKTTVHVRNGDDETAKMRGNEFKEHMVKRLDAHIYIEDDLAMLRTLVTRFPNILYLLVDRPWNQDNNLPSKIVRCGNWTNDDWGWNDIVAHIKNRVKAD